MRSPIPVIAVLLAASGAPPTRLSAATPVRVHLTTDGPGVSDSEEAQRLVKAFAKKLTRKKGLTVVESADQAQIRLEVREAEVYYEPRATTRVGRGGWKVPMGGIRGRDEKEFGVAAQSNRDIVLVVRLVEGETFKDFDSDPVDRTLDTAAGSVADEIDRWIRSHPRRTP